MIDNTIPNQKILNLEVKIKNLEEALKCKNPKQWASILLLKSEAGTITNLKATIKHLENEKKENIDSFNSKILALQHELESVRNENKGTNLNLQPSIDLNVLIKISKNSMHSIYGNMLWEFLINLNQARFHANNSENKKVFEIIQEMRDNLEKIASRDSNTSHEIVKLSDLFLEISNTSFSKESILKMLSNLDNQVEKMLKKELNINIKDSFADFDECCSDFSDEDYNEEIYEEKLS